MLYYFAYTKNAAGVADKSEKVNVVTSGCGELWTSAPSPHMPEYHGHYVTQQFLDDEDGETMIGEFDKDDLQGVQVGDHVWTFGGEWTTDDIYHIEVTQEELDEIDKVGQVDNFEKRLVEIPVPTLPATLSFGTVDGDDAQKKVAGDAAAKSPVWCEVGEHAVVRDDHWVTVYPGFPDCFECCKENEFLEATGMERNETGDIIDTDGQVFLTAAGYAATGYVTGDYAEYHQRTFVFERDQNWYKDTKKEDAEKKVAGTFTLYSLSLSRNVLDSVLNSVCCVLCAV